MAEKLWIQYRTPSEGTAYIGPFGSRATAASAVRARQRADWSGVRVITTTTKRYQQAGGRFDTGGPDGNNRTKRFTPDEWVGMPGYEWREAHRCSTPHNSSSENSRAQCAEWRAVSPTPAETDAAIARLHRHYRAGGTRTNFPGHSRTASRTARRAGRR